MVSRKVDPETHAYVWEIDEKNVPECFHKTLGEVLVSLHSIQKIKAAEAGLVVQTPDETRRSMKERMEAERIFLA